MAFSAPLCSDILKHAMCEDLPPIDTSLCCCSLIDSSLAAQQHLDDCVLHLLDPTLPQPTADDFNDASSSSGSTSPTEDHSMAKRRKHRESMARLRQSWRNSIAQLQREERHLQSELRRSLTATPTNQEPSVDPLAVLRQSYCALVQEQLQLQRERADLESASAHKEKYERLLQRELERARLFRAVSNNGAEEET